MTTPTSSDPIVQIRDLRFGYVGRPLFDGLDIAIARGKITAIMGPSGSGKTTLLRLIGGQLRPHSGSVTVLGENVHRLSRSDLFELRLRMGMMFQQSALFTDLSVFDNVAFPLREHTRLPEPLLRNVVLMKLQAVGLRGARDLMPAELSGGMTRRVALARATVMDPTIIMYDDPFSGQDPVTLGVLMKLIRQLNDGLGITSIIVSHDAEELAAICDELYLISGGRVVAHGAPKQLEASHEPSVEQFFRGLPNGPVAFHYPCAPMAADLFGDEARQRATS
jgi:phospholipid/cholesterol/gamma-HCH transport system ATP-binding protein